MTAIDLNLAQHLRITEGHVNEDGDELLIGLTR